MTKIEEMKKTQTVTLDLEMFEKMIQTMVDLGITEKQMDEIFPDMYVPDDDDYRVGGEFPRQFSINENYDAEFRIAFSTHGHKRAKALTSIWTSEMEKEWLRQLFAQFE